MSITHACTRQLGRFAFVTAILMALGSVPHTAARQPRAVGVGDPGRSGGGVSAPKVTVSKLRRTDPVNLNVGPLADRICLCGYVGQTAVGLKRCTAVSERAARERAGGGLPWALSTSLAHPLRPSPEY